MKQMIEYDIRSIELFNFFLQFILSEKQDIVFPKDLDEHFNEILDIARKQDLLFLIIHGMKKYRKTLPSHLKQEIVAGIYHNTQNEYMLKHAQKALSIAKIPYMPLKGVIIRDLYPEPWMRNSCDIDILVHEKDLDKAVQSLVKHGFRTENKREYHDISLYYGGTHLELHYNICENIPRIDGLLSRVWKHAVPVAESQYEYRETNEFFAYHIIAHILYHFLRGGSNVKQFVDFWLMRHKNFYNEEVVREILSSCRLERFYEILCEITDIWFGGKEQTELSRQIEKQVLNGRLSGSIENSDAVSIAMSGGKKRYIIRAIFLPLREMKWIYTRLRKFPVLLPIYYIKRIIYKTIGKGGERTKTIMDIDKDNQSVEMTFLKEMGL